LLTKLVNYEAAPAPGDPPMSAAEGIATPFDLAAATGDAQAAPGFLPPTRRTGVLNDQERQKLARHPFEVAAAVIEHYSTEGPEALLAVPGEVERLKWVGLYPQRQGGDAFMLRVKVPGGVLTAAQAREIGLVANEFCEGPIEHPMFGNRFCDLTTRQAIQLHWLSLAVVPEVWRRFAEVGLTSVQACGDCARNVTSCQVSGVDPNEVLDALPVARAISAFFTGNRAYANLPRKFKLSVTGCTEDCARGEINDVALRPARLGDELGFEVLAGGGLSDGERLASDLDLFVGQDDAVEVCRAVAQLYAELGNRENRGLARMRYLVQEIGPVAFRRELASRLGVAARSGAVALTTTYRSDHAGVHAQRQAGLSYVGAVVPVGRMTGTQLVGAAELADDFGDGTVRIGVDQNFVLSGVADERVDELLATPLLQAFSPHVGPFTRGIVACTGNEFCRYAVTETKQQAVELARRLDAAVEALGPDSAVRTTPMRVHVSGCSASCAQPQIADVGLRGAVHKGETQLLEGYDLGLGGALGPAAGFLQWVEGAVRVDDLDAAILRVAASYERDREGDESFASWARRHDVAELRDVVRGAS
jgi:ferredoxin-nitrite reductase